MSWETGTATSATDLLNKLDTFLKKGHALEIVYGGSNMGNGEITNLIGGASSVLETFALTCTATAPNGGTFSVVGSVSGNLGNATVGVAFSHAKVNFTITDGSTDCALNDTITFVMTPPWEQKRGVANSEYIWRAPGNDGASNIYVGAIYYSDAVADYYNLRLGGFTGYDNAAVFASQPGAVTRTHLPLWNQNMTYWFIGSGRRVIVLVKVSTVYVAAYLGFISPYGSPGEFPYPIAVGGSMAFAAEPAASSTSWRWSNATDENRAFPMAGAPGGFADDALQLRIRNMSGVWRGLACRLSAAYTTSTTGNIWPYSDTMNNWIPNLDGSYPMLPIILSENTPNLFGELDGVFALTGHQNAAENTITVGKQKYLVMQNVNRTAKQEYFAVILA